MTASAAVCRRKDTSGKECSRTKLPIHVRGHIYWICRVCDRSPETEEKQ